MLSRALVGLHLAFRFLWLCWTRPSRAFDFLKNRRGPGWGLRVVVAFNLAISATTLLSLHLLGREPALAPSITFLPVRHYYLAEIFFLPVLRTAVWLLGSAVIHLGLSLSGRKCDFDLLLNLSSLCYIVVMPVIFVIDWTALAAGRYGGPAFEGIHGTVALVLSGAWTVMGLHRLLDVGWVSGFALWLLSTLATVPLLAVFAR